MLCFPIPLQELETRSPVLVQRSDLAVDGEAFSLQRFEGIDEDWIIVVEEPFRGPCDINLEAQGRKNMSARETKKATAATPETVAEPFHEAMSSYEKALTAGIQLQEESVNLWKDLLSKLGSPEEFQAKLESMRTDAFPQARERM
jgi:hypothetical protein